MWRLMFDFARTTTNIAAASASSAAFFTLADWNTYDGFFASTTTCKAGSRSLAVAFRTQCFIWHFARLPSLQHITLQRRGANRACLAEAARVSRKQSSAHIRCRHRVAACYLSRSSSMTPVLRKRQTANQGDLFPVIPKGLASLGIDQMNPCASRTHYRFVDLVAILG
jgi:hypothetical protein